jgi:hypothetical protein
MAGRVAAEPRVITKLVDGEVNEQELFLPATETAPEQFPVFCTVTTGVGVVAAAGEKQDGNVHE